MISYTLPAIFRAPPTDPAMPYVPYVAPLTADLIETYTIPTIRAMLMELVALGNCHCPWHAPHTVFRLLLQVVQWVSQTR